jgi:hypothetical protein
MTPILLCFARIATLAICATTKPGREVLKRIGLRDRVPGAAPSDDVDYLRSACEGDLVEAERRLEVERTMYPDLTEAEHYRRAIRKVFNDRET